MQNINSIPVQQLMANLGRYIQGIPQAERIAYAPMTPEQQAWANRLPRQDVTQMNTNLNYIPTMQQINSMNALNARGLNTIDAQQMREAREAYDAILRQQQGLQ